MTTNNNNLSVSNLDFDGIKNNFKSFLKGQDTFKDYNFEGSSLSILLDLLAYNTHYMSFYANMIANEMFLDTATIRESIVSRAKMLGYTPRSRKTSVAYIDITIYVNVVSGQTPPSSITLDQYSQFSSSVNNVQYNFVTLESKVLSYNSDKSTATQWAYFLRDVDVYEGTLVNYSFNVTNPYPSNQFSQKNRFVIPSSVLDTDTLVISVQDSSTVLTSTIFNRADNLVGITNESPIYWVNETDNFFYELKFGDGVTFGKALQVGNIINASYIVTSGSDANGCKIFSPTTNNLSGWPTGLALEGASVTCATSSYVSLTLDQNYVSNFQVGESVVGSDSGATGKVISWNNVTGLLTLIPTNTNTFSYTKTSTGYLGEEVLGESGAVGIITMILSENSISSGGAERETDASIKMQAPLSYQTQNRCVTIKDYETLIKNTFYSTVKSIKVWSGESMVEPQYGKVYIAIRPYVGQILSTLDKNNVLSTIKDKNVLSIQPVIVDVDFIYIIPTCTVKYNPSQFNVKNSTINNIITQSIKDFASIYLNQFGSPFYYSDFIKYLSEADSSILSVNVDVTIKKNLDIPLLTSAEGIKVLFSNKIKKIENSANVNRSIRSSKFVFKNGLTETADCQLAISNTNNDRLVVVSGTTGSETIVTGGENVGSIDYETGTVVFNTFVISSTSVSQPENPDLEGRIEIYATGYDKDVFSTEHQVIDIMSSDSSNITTTDIRTIV